MHLILGNNTAHVISTANANQLALAMRLNEESVSGAERQALTRKLELVLKTTAAQAEEVQQKKIKAGRILPAHLGSASAAVNGAEGPAKRGAKTLVTEAHLETSIKSTRPRR